MVREAVVPHACVTEQRGPADAQRARTPTPALPAHATLGNRSLPPPEAGSGSPNEQMFPSLQSLKSGKVFRNYGPAFVLRLRKLRHRVHACSDVKRSL